MNFRPECKNGPRTCQKQPVLGSRPCCLRVSTPLELGAVIVSTTQRENPRQGGAINLVTNYHVGIPDRKGLAWTLSCPQTVHVTFLSAQRLTTALPIIDSIDPDRAQYRGEVLQHLSVLLLALGEPPLWVIEESVKIAKQWDLLLHADGHVIFHGVQGSENQVKHTHRVPVKKEKLGTWYQVCTF